MIYCRIIYLSIFFFLFSCKKKTEIISKDDSNTKIAYDYWSNYQFEKRVYKVFKKSTSQLIYIYNDTLMYIKDTNVSTSGRYYLQKYEFSNSKKYFIIGNERYENLVVKLGKSTFPLFDLRKIKSGTNFNNISYNGFPFENRYVVKYYTNFFENQPSNFGKLQTISSNILYNSSYGGGNETNIIDFRLAKNYGLVEMQYYYSSQNINSQKDTIFEEVYQLDKIIK